MAIFLPTKLWLKYHAAVGQADEPRRPTLAVIDGDDALSGQEAGVDFLELLGRSKTTLPVEISLMGYCSFGKAAQPKR